MPGFRLPAAVQLAGGNLDVLFQERADHVRCCKAIHRKLQWIEPNAHGVLALAKDIQSPTPGTRFRASLT